MSEAIECYWNAGNNWILLLILRFFRRSVFCLGIICVDDVLFDSAGSTGFQGVDLEVGIVLPLRMEGRSGVGLVGFIVLLHVPSG